MVGRQSFESLRTNRRIVQLGSLHEELIVTAISVTRVNGERRVLEAGRDPGRTSTIVVDRAELRRMILGIAASSSQRRPLKGLRKLIY